MGSTKALLLAGVVALASAGAAQAADLPPPPQFVPPPEVVDTTGWYLRGDVGVGIASSPDIRSTFYDGSGAALTGAALDQNVPSFARVQQSIGDSAFVDAGIGYQVNNWLRFDATGEYRTSQHVSTLESYAIDGAAFGGVGQYTGYDQYDGNVQSTVALVNAYVDLGTWWCFTPFIGAGVGAAFNRVDGLHDVGVGGPSIYDANGNFITGGVGNGGYGYARSKDSVDLAYQGTAGISYSVTPNVKLELAYRYLNMGTATSALINCVNSTGCVAEKHRYNLESNDIKLGVRWLFGDVGQAAYIPPAPESPIIRKY